MDNCQKIFNVLAIAVLFFLSISASTAQEYKKMMNDNSYNIYKVVDAAEKYFENRSKGKGSGWKNYQRWFAENEHKYYPSGDRSKIDPYFVSKAYNEFLRNNPVDRSLFNGSWVELGPLFVGMITGHYAAGLGRVEEFYIDQSNPNRIFLGSRSGGFWKTSDGGTTWTGGLTDFLSASGVNAIDVSPMNPSYILINVRNAQNGNSHGIYRSLNEGDTWTESAFNPTNLGLGGLGSNFSISKVAYHPSIANLVFIGTSEGLYRSTDDLTTTYWTKPVDAKNFVDIAFHPTNPNIIYAYPAKYYAQNDTCFVSTDAGVTFSATAIPGNGIEQGIITTSASCPDCVYFGSKNGIWKSNNSGVSFTFVNNPGQGRQGFAVSDLDDSNILMGYVDAYFSSDGGMNFDQVTYWSLGNTNGAGSGHQNSYNTSTDYIHADLRDAECYQGVFYGATDGFLVKSTDNGVTWEILSEGTGIRENYNLGVSQSNHYRTICGSQDNGTSINTENGWIEFYGADGMECLIHPLNDDYMIGSFQYGGRRRTKDGGISQEGVTPPSQGGSGNANWIAPLVYDPNNHMTIYNFSKSVYKSEDFCSSWVPLGSPATFTSTISHATISENNSAIIVIVSGNKIEKSIDGGISFTDIKNNLPNISITDVAFDPNDDNVIVVTYGSYQNDNSKVYVSTDQGANWQNITYNLNDMPIRSVVIDHTTTSTIYLGAEIGVYKKAMVDNTWSLYNPDLPNMSTRELEIMRGTNTLRAATWGRGLWEYTLDGREDFPTIINTFITNPPTDYSPKEGMDQYVTSEITYDNTLTNVYLEWSIDTASFGNVIPMNNTGGDIWVSDSPIPDQPVGTKVYFKVFAVGSAGDTTETYKFMYTVKPFEFCEAIGTSTQGNLYIKEVSIANMTNQSLNDSYTFYQGSLVELDLDSTYTITVEANNGWSSNDYGAWIDYNMDANFDSSEEILFSIGPGNVATANFTVPSTAMTEDILRLRIRLSYWGSDPSPCGTTLGEVEDYPVWITGPCELTVNTTATSGWGSLPYAIDCADPGQTINFDSSLDGLTIALGSENILIDKDLIIQSDPGLDITVSAVANKPAFAIASGVMVTLKNFSIESTSPNREAILNQGNLTIDDMNLKSNPGIECIENTSPGNLTVLGNCQLEQH